MFNDEQSDIDSDDDFFDIAHDGFSLSIDEPEFLMPSLSDLEAIDFSLFGTRKIGNLTFEDKGGFNDIELAEFIENADLDVLDLHSDALCSDKLTACSAPLLAANSSITTLNLEGNRLKDEGAISLSENASITFLNLAGNEVTDEGIKALAKSPHLRELNLRFLDRGALLNDDGYDNVGPITDTGASYLSKSSITALDLSGNQITDKGAISLADNPHLTSLKLNWCFLTDEAIEALANHPNLIELHINDCYEQSWESATTNPLELLSSGKYMDFDFMNNDEGDVVNHPLGKITDQGARALFFNQKLRALDIDNHQLSNACELALDKHIEQNNNLATIERQFQWGSRFNMFNSDRQQSRKESFLCDVEIISTEHVYK